MAVIQDLLVEATRIVARAADETASTTASSETSAESSNVPDNNKDNNGSSSPLLFFVALGFGVVFTNLW